MSHMIEKTDNMVSTEVPWHGLGVRVPGGATSEDLRELVFPWTAIERPIYLLPDGVTCAHECIDTHRAICRSDNGAVLSVMPKTYGVVQYHEALAILDAAAEGGARYLSAGTLAGGKRAWALADLPSATFDVAGAELKPYLLLSTAHDGSRAVRALFTSVYVVCNNTETAALSVAGVGSGMKGKRVPNVIQINHARNAAEHVRQAAGVVAKAREYFGAFHEAALVLANARFTAIEMAELADRLFPVGAEAKIAHTAAAVKVVELFKSGQRAAACAPGTKWAAYNAVTELVDHHRRAKTVETRFDQSQFGAGAGAKQQAMDLLLAA